MISQECGNEAAEGAAAAQNEENNRSLALAGRGDQVRRLGTHEHSTLMGRGGPRQCSSSSLLIDSRYAHPVSECQQKIEARPQMNLSAPKRNTML